MPPTRASLNVSVTPEHDEFINSRVASGRYMSASEVVEEGLRLLEERERDRDEAFRELKDKVRRGIEEADRGEFFTGKQVLEEIQQIKARRLADKGNNILDKIA